MLFPNELYVVMIWKVDIKSRVFVVLIVSDLPIF